VNRLDHFLAAFGLARIETRDADPRLHPDTWSRAFPSSPFWSGGVESNLSTALACVHLQSVVLAGLPFAPYRRLSDGARERIREGSLARIIDAPNAWQSRFDLIESIVRSLHFVGNAYFEVKYDRDGLFESLTPLSPSSVTVEQTTSGAVRLKVSEPGRARTLVAGEYLHVRNPGNSATDLVGVSTVQRARGALGFAMTIQDSASHRADRGFQQTGFLKSNININHAGLRGEKALQALGNAQGAVSNGTFGVLPEGYDFIPTHFSASDSQVIEQLAHNALAVAQVFNTPPGMVGIQQTQSYGSQQQDAQNFVTTCLGPLANRIESSFERCLLSDETRAEVFFEFELDGLLRTDPNERWRTYEVARRTGAMSPNEVRRLENMPPRTDPGGDSYDPPKSQTPAQAEPPIASAT